LTSKSQVICLVQCGGLWFVNGKVSITWNLKQAMVQRPKGSLNGQCLLRPKAGDMEKLKTATREEDVDPDGAITATIVQDSDDEDEYVQPVAKMTEVVKPAPVAAPAVAVEEAKDGTIKKKRIDGWRSGTTLKPARI
jgi:hypothetical protein